MITTHVPLHFMIYSLMWLFSSHKIIAPSSIVLLDAVHDSSSRLSGIHDAGAVKSTIEASGEKSSYSQPCRQDIEGCDLDARSGVLSTEMSTASDASQTAKEFQVAQILAPSKSWKMSAALALRRLEGKALIGLFPKLRDDWNLAYAGYEEVLAGAIRSKADWADTEALAATLADMSTARQRSTAILGLSPEVKKYILQTRLPELYHKLASSLREELDHLLGNGGLQRATESKIAILNQLFRVELQDPELEPHLKPLESKLYSLNEQHVPTPETEVPEKLSAAEIPPRPSFWAFNRLREQPPQSPNPEKVWARINYQFEAEKSHLEYLRGINKPILSEWSLIEHLTTEFTASARQSAWLETKFQPEKLKVSEYKTLEHINLQRRALIEHATQVAARPLASPALSLGEMKLLRQIELETLMIEGGAEHSDQVREILAGLVEGGNVEAEPFLKQVDIDRDPESDVPDTADGLNFLR